jgi:uncharacterized protein (DUF433 family)
VSKKFLTAIAGSALAAFIGLQMAAPAFAASKVPCDQIMQELDSGKKAAEVAKDLGCTVGHVRYCKAKAKKAAKAAAAAASPAAAPAPAAAAPAAPAPAASPAAK